MLHHNINPCSWEGSGCLCGGWGWDVIVVGGEGGFLVLGLLEIVHVHGGDNAFLP